MARGQAAWAPWAAGVPECCPMSGAPPRSEEGPHLICPTPAGEGRRAHARQRPVQGAPTPAWCLLAEAPGPWPMGRGVGYAEGGGSAPATSPSSSRCPHTGGALAPLCHPSVPLGTSWACESFAVSSQGFAGDASGFVSWGPLPEIGFRDLAGLDLSGDGSQALGDLPVLPATVAGRG